MMKTILASLAGASSDRTVLDAAVAAARIDGGQVQCLHMRVDPEEAAALYGAIAPRRLDQVRQLVQEIHDAEQVKSGHAKAAFEETCKRHELAISQAPAKGGVSAFWREAKAIPGDVLREARFHDLVVMARGEESSSGGIKSVLMQSGRPVLIAPPKPVEIMGRKVAIAWKEGPEAARALTAASAFLSRAEHVAIVCVAENASGGDTERKSAEYLARQLRWYGAGVEVRMNEEHSGPAAAKIREMAYEIDADLLVMGAYGHSRLQEFVFGGVTRDMLSDCAIPVLMFR